MNVLEIPGYAEAVVKERVIRDASFLGITESVGPFEVVPMTLRHYLVLRAMRSPLLGKETPSPDDLASFLWLLSPQYTPAGGRVKARFVRACRKSFYPPRYLPLVNTARARARHQRKCDAKLAVAAEIITKARTYVDESMQDRPPVQSTVGFQAEHISDGAYFCALFGREYGWTQEETLNTPLKRVFQYCTEQKIHHGSKVPLCNPSDRVKSRWMRSLACNQKGAGRG
jgi:hypothetical protein